jgi:demethylmenaquinone methyltransferase/2-methoxy-6-polyprenyl-1,4-benzoquinol methylase
MDTKQADIILMFNKIAKTYDLANRILSIGIDKIWRKKACNIAYKIYNKKHLDLIVDVACGTGDLMIDWKKFANLSDIYIDKIVGVDPSVGMMKVGKMKIKDAIFIEAGAENMPLENECADIISISYGIRNVIQRQKGISEFARVLKPNGLMVILEFTKDEKKGVLRTFKKFYMHNIMPIIGGLISGNKEAYVYLPESIDNFITTKQMCEELEEVGLKPIFVQGYSLDMSTTFIAKKIIK